MKEVGQIVLFRFPRTDLAIGKLRPALMLGRLPGSYDDWLVCMISTQLRHYGQGFDEIIAANDSDFATSGLKATSVFRIGRLAVIDGTVLPGAVGEIAPERLQRIKTRLARWLEQV